MSQARHDLPYQSATLRRVRLAATKRLKVAAGVNLEGLPDDEARARYKANLEYYSRLMRSVGPVADAMDRALAHALLCDFTDADVAAGLTDAQIADGIEAAIRACALEELKYIDHMPAAP